ncbi:MAG TPA: RNA-binding protein [Candidatus Babeliales bacterium]|nr:RNA-binding protein [Candidatus Babeliales bacterium]
MNIYVGNIAHAATEDQLRQLFEQYGEVTSVKLVKDKFTGSSRGFGFVEMGTEKDGDAAIAALDNNEFMGRTLRVNKARPREERPRTSGGGGERRYSGGGGGGGGRSFGGDRFGGDRGGSSRY